MGGTIIALFITLIVAYKSFVIVEESKVYIVERLGKYHKTFTAGLNLAWPFLDKIRAIVDLREQIISTPAQAITTRDNISTEVVVLINYIITDPVKAVYETNDFKLSIINSALNKLQVLISDIYSDEISSESSSIAEEIKRTLESESIEKGYSINTVTIKTSNTNT